MEGILELGKWRKALSFGCAKAEALN